MTSPLQLYRSWRYANDLKAQLSAAQFSLNRMLPSFRGRTMVVHAEGLTWSIQVSDDDAPQLTIEPQP